MAKLPALVAAIAKHDPRGEVVVANYARTIREAGLIPTTKRGAGASEMTPTEGCNLLLALSEVGNARKAPETVRLLREAIMFGPWPDEPDDDPAIGLTDFAIGEHTQSLGVFLEQLIRCIGAHGICMPSKDRRSSLLFSEIKLTAPDSWGASAKIVFNYMQPDEFEVEFSALTERAVKLSETDASLDERYERLMQSHGPANAPGISFEVRLTASVVSDVARCLAGADGRAHRDAV